MRSDCIVYSYIIICKSSFVIICISQVAKVCMWSCQIIACQSSSSSPTLWVLRNKFSPSNLAACSSITEPSHGPKGEYLFSTHTFQLKASKSCVKTFCAMAPKFTLKIHLFAFQIIICLQIPSLYGFNTGRQ